MAKNPERALAPRLALAVQYATRERNVPGRARFRRWAKAALARDAGLTLRLVDAPEGRALNRRYRRKDYPTNVLTFAYDDRSPLYGDIVLCAPVIAQEARRQGIAAEAHYAHLTVHGMLHLQGYEHEHPHAAAVMESLESAIVTKLGYADPYHRETGSGRREMGEH